MRLSSEQLQEFKIIYKADCGIDLSDEEARHLGTTLARLYLMISEPVTQEEHENVLSYRKSVYQKMAKNGTLQDFLKEIKLIR